MCFFLFLPPAYLFAGFGACPFARVSCTSRRYGYFPLKISVFAPVLEWRSRPGRQEDLDRTRPQESIKSVLGQGLSQGASLTHISHGMLTCTGLPLSWLGHLDTVTYHAPLTWVRSSVGFILWMELKPTACPSCPRQIHRIPLL